MTDVTPIQIIRDIAPEFSSVDEETVIKWICLTEPLVSKKRFKSLHSQALALLTAHRMKLATVGTDPGSDPLTDVANIGIGGLTRVSNYSEGEVTIGFNSNMTQYASLNAELALTSYGVQYLSILRMRIMSITSAGESIGRT